MPLRHERNRYLFCQSISPNLAQGIWNTTKAEKVGGRHTPHDVATRETENEGAAPDAVRIHRSQHFFLLCVAHGKVWVRGGGEREWAILRERGREEEEEVRLVFALGGEEVGEEGGHDDEDEADYGAGAV